MKRAGGAGRQEGVHMVHTFEEVRTRTPADPTEAAPEVIMPQAAWEALLRDAVQGLCPLYTPKALRQWLQATHPQAWAIGAPPPPHHHHTGKGKGTGKGRARDSKGHSGKGPQRGRRPVGQGTGRDTTWGQETTQGPGRDRSGDRGTEEEGTTAGAATHTQERHTTTEGPAPHQPM